MIYTNDIEVDIHEVDYNGVARASALMRYMQTAAQNQLTENGMSYDELIERNRAFILSRITMEFSAPLRAYDRISALSFPCESRGFSFLRCHALEKEGQPIAKALSVWALIDTETRGLVKVNDFELGLTTNKPLDISLARFVIPKEISPVGSFKVRYSDTDQNRHMNNTRYPDMYSDFLPLEKKRIERISINYLNEAPAGEELTVYSCVDEMGIYYFRTVRKDGLTNTEAQIMLCDI